LFAKGRPVLHRHAVLASAAAMLVVIYPACKFMGPVGGQITALLAVAVGYLFQLIQLGRVTGLNLFRYGSAFVLPTLGSAAMLIIVLGGRHLGLAVNPSADIAVCAGSCLIAYAICALARLRASKRHHRLYDSKTPESVVAP